MDCREGLKQLEPESINCCITSPPYWSLRDYGILATVWDGDPDCEHDFELEEKKCGGGHSGGIETSSLFTKEQAIKRKEGTGSGNIIKEGFCSKCGAWKGTLGLEPNFELYIKHLCDIYDGVKRVLKKSGTCWVNLGDTYASNSTEGYTTSKRWQHKESRNSNPEGWDQNLVQKREKLKIPPKCLLMLPQRFAIEMINRGWILRNIIIWHKPNCMPSSAKDRFTVDFEYVYFFVKSNETQYWINEKIGRSVGKRPLGSKGIEGVDWEWRECGKCLGTGIKHKKCKFCVETGWYYDEFLRPRKCPKCRGLGRIKMDSECKSCKGKGIKKYNFWKGRQYSFEQQIDQSTTKFIYSRSSQKGDIQETNNPRKNWGKTKKELENEGYNSKYKNHEHGQTIQGFIRTDSIKEERDQSRIDAQNLFPNNRKKQQEYINHIHDHGKTSSQGRNKRTVWTIPTKPNPETHFATFPTKLVEPMILSGCPEVICKVCGTPREKIIERIVGDQRPNEPDQKRVEAGVLKGGGIPTTSRPLSDIFAQALSTRMVTKGYSDCNHGSQWKAGIVLDPFAGIGTTLLTAWKLGRNYIGFEISKEYCKIANKKLNITKYIRLDNFIEEKIEGNV